MTTNRWDFLNRSQKAEMIKNMAFTLCNGDDLDIDVSNIGREVFENFGLSVHDVETALYEIARRLKMAAKQ